MILSELSAVNQQGPWDPVGSRCHLFDPGVKSVVIHMNFGQQQFDWVDLDSVLSKWQLPFSRISCGIAIVLKTWQKQRDDTFDGSEIQLTSLRLVVYPHYLAWVVYIPGGDREISEPSKVCLGDGFKYLLLSSLPGEMIQFD